MYNWCGPRFGASFLRFLRVCNYFTFSARDTHRRDFHGINYHTLRTNPAAYQKLAKWAGATLPIKTYK